MPGSRPLLAGYALVAMVAAWLAGIALRAAGPLAALGMSVWLLLAGAWLGVWLGAWLVSQHGAAAMRWRRSLLATGVLGCCALLGAARAAGGDPTTDARSVGRLALGTAVVLRGMVAAEPDLRDGKRLLTVEASQVSADGGRTWRPATGRVEVTVYGPDDWFAPAYGDTLSLSGTLQPLGSGYTPPGVVARMPSARASIRARGGGNPLLERLFALRVRLAQVIQHTLPEPEAALLIGILLGLKTPVLRARLALFTTTGTIHLVVPAGLKVSVLAELASAAARPLGRTSQTILGIGSVALYAALGGGGPAALRAAIMGVLLVLAPALGRRYDVFTALALAAFIMTVIEPLVIYDAGFQLTTLATLGLPLFVPPIQRWLAGLVGPLRHVAGVGLAVELIAVTLAAQLATLPVLVLTFHLISLVAPLANLLAVPLLAPLMALGGALALVGLLAGPVAGTALLALSWIVWPLLWLMDTVIAGCAALPFAALAVPDLAGIFAWAYYAALAGAQWWAMPWLRRLRAQTVPAPATAVAHGTGHVRLGRGLLAGLLALAALGAVGATVPVALAGDAARLDFLDVGPGGEAALLRLPSGTTVLINGGPTGPALEVALAGRLPFWQRTIDLAILTDPRPGDARGLQDAASHFTFTQAADAGMAHPSPDYLAWLDVLTRTSARHARVRQGDTLALDATTRIRVLSPPQQLYPPGEGDTTASADAILRLETPGLRVLFLGSADAYALDALAGSGQSLAADVVEVALAPGQTLDLSGPLGTVLAAAHPRLVVIGDAPLAPTSRAARRLADTARWLPDADASAALGALVYRTSAAGTISLSGGAGGWGLGG